MDGVGMEGRSRAAVELAVARIHTDPVNTSRKLEWIWSLPAWFLDYVSMDELVRMIDHDLVPGLQRIQVTGEWDFQLHREPVLAEHVYFPSTRIPRPPAGASTP